MDDYPNNSYTPMQPLASNSYDETSYQEAKSSSSNAHLNASAPVFQPGGMTASQSGGQHSSNFWASQAQDHSETTPPPFPHSIAPSSFNFISGPPLMPPASFHRLSSSPTFGFPSPSYNHNGYIISPGAGQPSPMALPPSWTMIQQSSSSSGHSGGRRGSRGVPDYKPLKSTGHNSKPSVSMNPAALAKVMASQRPKKRTVVVRLPKESNEDRDTNVIIEEDSTAEELKGADKEFDLKYPWTRRWPSEDVDVNILGPALPSDCILSRQVYPEANYYSHEFVDIYLPIQGAWDELKEVFSQERIKLHDQERARRTTESRLVTLDEDAPEQVIGPFLNSDNLPPISTPLNGPRNKLSSSPSTRHSENISLSIPSAGQPFGPTTLSALGLQSPKMEHPTFSSSDADISQIPALGERPEIGDQGPRRTSLQSGDSKAKSLLIELGRGFGYNVEVEEDHLSSTYTRSRPPSREQLHGQETLEFEQDENQSGPWQERRRQISGINSEDEGDIDSDLPDSDSISDNFSNPSDEEEAQRYKKALIEQEKAVMAITMQLQINESEQNRTRSDTGQTFASSSINPEDMDQQPRRYSILPRGPLDDDESQEQGIDFNSGYKFGLQSSSNLHPDAPVFLPKGDVFSTSIKTSSFVHKNEGSLNAAAPPFRPGAFTFTAPEVAPKLPSLLQGHFHDATFRESQGREKRQRHRNQDNVEVESKLQSLDSEAGFLKPTAAPFYPTLSHGALSSAPQVAALQRRAVEHDRFNDAIDDQENLTEQIQGNNSSRSNSAKRTPLSAVWQQGDVPPLQIQSSQQASSISRLSRFAKNASGKSSEVATDDPAHMESDDDDDGISDIIGELGDRVDSALEVWAERILNKVVIMGQVRPMVTLDTVEKQSLIELITKEMQNILASQFSSFTQGFQDAGLGRMKLLQNITSHGDSALTTRPRREAIGNSTLDSDGQVDFDYVQDTLDQKISNLRRDLSAAFESALPRAMESMTKQQMKGLVDSTKIDALVRRLDELAMSTSVKNMSTSLSEISSESLDTVVCLLIERLQPILQEASDNNTRHRRAELTDVLEPLLEDHLARSQAVAKADRQVVSHLMSEQITEETTIRAKDWKQNLSEFKQTFREQMNTALVESLLPHMEMLRTDHLNADVIAARVVEVLNPVLGKNKTQDGTVTEIDSSHIIAEVVDKIRPALTDITRSTSLVKDEDDFIVRLVEAVGAAWKSKAEQRLDLNAVMACLEPLVEKQEESRLLARKLLDNQREMDHIPSAVDGRLDTFLAASQNIQEAHQSIMEKLDNLVNHEKNVEGNQSGGILVQLDQARQAEMELRAQLMENHAELSAATGNSSMLREECSRLELRLDQAEKDANEISLETNGLRIREKEAVDRCLQAEHRISETEAEKRECQAALRASQEQIQVLRSHVDAIAAEASEFRQERARERETTAQAIAEALASRKEADMTLSKERNLKEDMMAHRRQSENETRKLLQENAERAAKAEGQVMTLEKRISDQDAKITNLQQLSATQKQKAAQGGQKLAEVEKKLKEMEEKEKDWILGRARLQEMEFRLRNQDQLETVLRASQMSESRLREEVNSNQARFAEVERDLMQMKETLVDREILDQANDQLARSREEIALLKGRLVETQWRENEQEQQILPPPIIKRSSHGGRSAAAVRPAWEQSPSHGSSTWASIHAPNSSSIDEMDPTQVSFNEDSFESVHNTSESISHSHRSSNNSRAVEVNEEGWWS